MTYLRNTNFWMFGLFFFFYFFIMGAYFPFFPIWLHDVNQISKSDTGVIFACISFFSLVFQPVFGLLSDKLGLRKHLLWVITLMLVMFAPFFIYVFGPLLKTHILLGSIVGGIYLGFIYNGGAPAIEAYIEKVSRRSQFEFGRARMFGCIGWAICASIAGIMFTINNQFVFWLGSGCALILAVLLWFARPQAGPTEKVVQSLGANHHAFSVRLALELLKQPKLWFLSLYVVGVACTYEVFDQQFANFFTSFFSSPQEGTRVFGYVTTLGELLNAFIMFFAPLIVNRIGGKNALLVAGFIMSIRIIGSSFASTPLEVVVLKTLHMFEIPFLIVGCFKYITTQFEVRFSATIYLVCFCFFKQLAMMGMSLFAGYMYDKAGFHGTYLMLGIIAGTFTLISAFTLSGQASARAVTPSVSKG
ncbi:MFS transporter [Pantoea sp. 1.19]|uniref:MFS transporter n=1 Tax=Pantoea sp. 1.19 TaxID=1925589 RepID=UPI0009490277|nr:MFS transporter [Pantoea sp. 1.19]